MENSIVEDNSLSQAEQDFIAAMDDDINSAKAIAVLFDLNRQIRNEQLPRTQREQAALMLVKLGRVLGFFQNLESILQDSVPDCPNN